MSMITKIQQGRTTYNIGIPSGLTESEKAQIRENIGAISESEAGVVVDGTYPDMTVGEATHALKADEATNATNATNATTAGAEVTTSIATTQWSNNSATALVTGVTPTSKLIISPDDASAAEFVACGVTATAQTEGTITFTCTTTPTEAITVQILIL